MELISTKGTVAGVERQKYSQAEDAIRKSGWLFLLSAVAMLGFGYGEFHTAANSSAVANLTKGTLMIIVGFGQVLCSFGLFALARWVFLPACLLSAAGMILGPPFGMIVNGVVLYMLLSSSGRRVFQSDYKEVVAATRRVKRRRSHAVALVFLLLVAWVVVYVCCLANAPW